MSSSKVSPVTLSLVVAALGLGLGLWGVVQGVMASDARPLMGWLIGVGYWLAPMIGLLMLTQLLYVFDAGWSAIVRRQMEHLLAGFKWVALALVPLLVLPWISEHPGLLWKWLEPGKALVTGHGTVATDPLYLHKSGYLDKGFFAVRSALFLILWVALAEFFRQMSFRADGDRSAKYYSLARRWAAGGVVLVGLTLTFGAIDWFKSLDYHWFSTMYGVWFFAASMFSGIALTIITVRLAQARGELTGLITSAQYYLLGCLLLAFTIFWAYISFSQYLIIYSANIPEETFWYVVREITPGGQMSSWGLLAIVGLIGGHFLAPFLSLLFYSSKVNTWRLVGIAVWCLVFHLADIYWNILPGYTKLADGSVGYRAFSIQLWELATLVGLGGVVVASYLHSRARHSALPKHDPRVEEALHYHV